MQIPFPEPITHMGRLCFWRLDCELYKAKLAVAAKGGNPDHVKLKQEGPDSLVLASTFAAELAISRRTLGRLIAGVEGPGRKPVGKPADDRREASAA